MTLDIIKKSKKEKNWKLNIGFGKLGRGFISL